MLEDSRVTTSQLLRRRIAPIAFGVAIALMARKSCQGEDVTHATFVLSYGAAEPAVKVVDAELWMNQVEVATYHRRALDSHIGPSQFAGAFPANDGELRLDVELRSGEHRQFVRTVRFDEGATVTVNLEPDLAKP